MTLRIIATLMVSVGLSSIALASGDSSAHGGPLDALFTKTMAYKAGNFFLLLLILHFFVKKPLTNMLKASATSTKDRLEASKRQVEAKQAELKEFNANLVELEKELESRKTKAVQSIEQEKNRILSDAKAQAEHLEQAANKRIDQNITKAKAEIREFLATEAANHAEGQIQKDLDASKQETLMKSYISTLDA